MLNNLLATRNKPALIAVALLLSLLFLFLFTGCVPKAAATKVDPQASQATTPMDAVTPPAEPAKTDILAFGDTVTWENNVSLSVSAPAPYTPSEYSAGSVEGYQTVAIEFVLTNNSGDIFEPAVYSTASSGGVEAPGVFDYDQGMTLPPTTAVLAGQTIKWQQAFSVADPAAITLQVSAGFEYDDAIFTNIP